MTNIYFIKNGETVKIGRSQNVEKRLKELQTGNSNQLEILYVIEDMDEKFEGFVQSICEVYKLNGEWFDLKAVDHLLNIPWYKEHMVEYKKPT